MKSSSHSTFLLEDGASLAYEVLGARKEALPIILVGGLSSTRQDWQRLAVPLAASRPVVVYDHRGIGDSHFSSMDEDEISIESMARDLKALVNYLGYKEVAICGFSMGGVIAQQLLFLPYHPSQPTELGFEVTHVLLAASMTAKLRDRNYGPPIDLSPRSANKSKLDRARPMVEAMFDPAWIADTSNSASLERWLQQSIVKRPLGTIIKQMRATNRFDFSPYYERHASSTTRILVIHGELDRILPFYGQDQILSLYPSARAIEVGSSAGQVPHLAFGHAWYEYFDIDVWVNVVEKFLEEKGGVKTRSRL